MRYAVAFITIAALAGCTPFPLIFARNADQLGREPYPVLNKVSDPIRHDVRLSALWVGHATVLLQIEDKVVMTDPVLTDSIGVVSPRIVELGINLEDIPQLDAVVLSHMHFDHLSYGSLDEIEAKTNHLFLPEDGLVYLPDYDFEATELKTWQSFELDGMRITAVPVKHSGFRYGADNHWMKQGFTGYVIEYKGVTVYFGGDTAWDEDAFRETAMRFPSIDLALMPIGPVEPAEFARPNHIDPAEALEAFEILGAKWMVPIHFDTFFHGLDTVGDAPRLLDQAVRERHIESGRVIQLAPGEQRVFIEVAYSDPNSSS